MSILLSHNGLITAQEPMAEHTTCKCGGIADYAAAPTSLFELRKVLQIAQEQSLPITIIGGGSNILVSDLGIRGLSIFTKRLNSCHVRGELLCVRTGLSLDKAINFAIENGLHGMERLGGIPGTIGGAITGNAGVPGRAISQLLEHVDYVTLDGKLHRMEAAPDLFSYRHSFFSDRNDIILFEAGLRLAPTLQTAEARLRKEQAKAKRRMEGQFDYASAGCMFKNPSPEISAGKLIEDCGFKGMKLGGAQVSPLHANFFINPEHKATSSDFWNLSELVRQGVKEQLGVELEREIRLIGEWETPLTN